MLLSDPLSVLIEVLEQEDVGGWVVCKGHAVGIHTNSLAFPSQTVAIELVVLRVVGECLGRTVDGHLGERSLPLDLPLQVHLAYAA